MPVVTGDITKLAGTAITSGEVRFTATKPIVQDPNAGTTRLATSVAQHVVTLDGSGSISTTIPATGDDWVYRVEVNAYVGGNLVHGLPKLLLEVPASGADLSEAGVEGSPSGRVVVNRLVGTQELTTAVAPIQATADNALSVASSARATAGEAKSDAGNAVDRVENLETLGGVAPGDVNDANMALHINQPDSQARTALNAATVQATAPVDAGTVVDLWEPPTQPAGPDLTQWDAVDVYAQWDALVTADPSYVSRSSIGNGTDGLPIYAYTFTPPAYGNTIMLSAEHGGEKIAMYAAGRMMELLVTDWRNHPALAALRTRTRIVVVPVASRTAVDSNARKNANGVDLNRNWDYKWEAYPSDPADVTYKGTAPFSEPETQALRDLILSLEAEGGLVAAIDLHDTGATARPDGYHFFANLPDRVLDTGGDWVRELTNQIAASQGVTNPNRALTLSGQPQMQNWVAARGIWSATIEYEQRWGSVGMDSTNQTAALRFVGNAILRSASQGAPITQKPQAFVRHLTFTSGASTVTIPVGSGNGSELVELGFEFTPPSAGIVEFFGNVSCGGPSASQITITPAVGQLGTSAGPNTPNAAYDSLFLSHNGGNTAGSIVIPFSVARGVVEDPFPVKVQIFAFATTAASYVYRYRGIIKFTPSHDPGRYELYTATGRTGAGAQQIVKGV